MALIKCSECGKEISDTTSKCIHCGHSLAKKETKKPEKKKLKSILKILLFIIGIILLWFAIAIIFPKKSVDYTVKYKDYLDYALGTDWEVTEASKDKYFENFWFREYTYWTISYSVNNQKEEITLYNRFGGRYKS